MQYEAVIYSHYSIARPETISSMALLYDRVILPLADWAASESPQGRSLAANCEAVQTLLRTTDSLRRGQNPILRPLNKEDSVLARADEHFEKAFNIYLSNRNISWDALCSNKSLGEAFGVLHQFIGNTLVSEAPIRRIPVHCAADDAMTDGTIHGLAHFLGVAVADFAIPQLFVNTQQLDAVRNCILGDPFRQDFLTKMLEFGKDCQQDLSKATSPEEKRDVIRCHIEQLKDSWQKWYRKLKTLENMGWLKVKAGTDNLLTVTTQAVTIKSKSKFGLLVKFFQADIEKEKSSIAHDLLGKSLLEVTDEKVFWHRHLLAVKLKMEELYGESRGFTSPIPK